MVLLFDQFNLPEDVFQIVFATDQQVDVGKLLVSEMKKANNEFNKQQMSEFAMTLHDGVTVSKTVKVGLTTQKKQSKLSYNKRQFYDRILTPMKGMGLIDYDLYKKTYQISEKFTKTMTRLAAMWVNEAKKPAFKYRES
ncbi:MAG: hypothetical protein ACI8Y7_000813 [Candidatus Woesearchaeota archaeon]|jgi:hypothetical protein